MKQSGIVFKFMPVLLAFCFVISGIFGSSFSVDVMAAQSNDNYDNMSVEEKQAYLEQKIKETNQKLDNLGNQSKETEEYISVLDEKISYLQREMKLSSDRIEQSRSKIATLQKQQAENEKEISNLQSDIEKLSVQTQELQKAFDETFVLYGKRAKAMYVSGDMNMLSLLLTCDDISTLFTRVEMIKRISRSDKQLLEQLQNEGNELSSAKEEFTNKKTKLDENQKTLAATEQTLKQSVSDLEKQQISYKEKQTLYESQKSESDSLLEKLHAQTQTYSEYRTTDLADLEEINAEIEAAAEEARKELEAEEAKKTTASTSQQTQKNPENSSQKPTDKPSTETTKKTETASNKLSLTYPVPAYKKITTAFGSEGYAGHSGVDFACPSGQRVVAAESGIVITSTDITSHSNCHCSNTGGGYHSYGRYIVIMHDKKDAAGNYVYTLYAHNSSRVVSKGDRVSKGQLIAYSGTTGNSTGPHCHFEVRTPSASYDDCVNPKRYLP